MKDLKIWPGKMREYLCRHFAAVYKLSDFGSLQ